MITKEYEIKKYCCFYASDFHLEMILLPYIKNNIDKDKFIIFTEEDLSESMKILLNRINLTSDEKNFVLNLDWNIKKNLKKYDLDNHTIIINGSRNYIFKINEEIKEIKPKKINIIDCYSINDENLEIKVIQENYDEILNTKKYKK